MEQQIKTIRPKKTIHLAKIAVLAFACIISVSCMRHSGETWAIRSAELPEDWPELTPVGVVEVKRYPVYRAAYAKSKDVGDDTGLMFRALFEHIQEKNIAMTAPVEMVYQDTDPVAPRMSSMAFFYRTRDTGAIGQIKNINVRDAKSEMFSSVGLRGAYSDKNFKKGLALLNAWLKDNAGVWQAAGPPRFLGYNSPFVLPFMRYGEVQIPIRPHAQSKAGDEALN